MKLTRRVFIELAGSSALMASAPSLLAQGVTVKRLPLPCSPAQGRWIGSACQGCTQYCAIEVFNQNGRATRVRGNQHSQGNHGFCCPRGHLIPQENYDPDRIKQPLKRTNPQKGRGIDPKWIPITWDEALDIVADKMMELRNAGEPERLLYLKGRYGNTSHALLYGTVAKLFGSPNNFSTSALCAETEKMGPGYTQGLFSYRDYDLGNSKCVVFWGTDPFASNRQVPNVISRLGTLQKNGTLITVDPRLSTAAAKSKEWLPLLPGTDGALANAIAHVLLTEGLWNKEFVGDFVDSKNQFIAGKTVKPEAFKENNTLGLVTYWNEEAKDWTPEKAGKECRLDPEQIRRVARTLGKAAPNVIVWMGPGVCMNPRGTYSAMVVHALNGILGSVDNVGGTHDPVKALTGKYPSMDKYVDELAKTHGKGKKIDGRGDKDMPAAMKAKLGSGVVTNNIANYMLEHPDFIKVMISSWTNTPFAASDGKRWEKALSNVPFFVHMVPFPSEMTLCADIVLPSTFNAAEGMGAVTGFGSMHAWTSLQQPTCDRIWDVKQEENEVTWLLAEKLAKKGWPALLNYYANEFADPETGAKPTNEKEFQLITTKIASAPCWLHGSKPIPGDQINGWEDFRQRGMHNSAPQTYKKHWGCKFPTPSGKFEFVSGDLKKVLETHAAKYNSTPDQILELCNYQARGIKGWMPHYEAPLRHGDQQQFPFLFIDHKSRLNREGRSANLPWMQEFKKCDAGDRSWGDVLKINPIDAKALGLKDNDLVEISSPVGTIVTEVKLWEGVGPGTVAKAYGQGHWAYGQIAAKEYGKTPRGGNNNEILVDDYDRLSGTSCRNGGYTRVSIKKVSSNN